MFVLPGSCVEKTSRMVYKKVELARKERIFVDRPWQSWLLSSSGTLYAASPYGPSFADNDQRPGSNAKISN